MARVISAGWEKKGFDMSRGGGIAEWASSNGMMPAEEKRDDVDTSCASEAKPWGKIGEEPGLGAKGGEKQAGSRKKGSKTCLDAQKKIRNRKKTRRDGQVLSSEKERASTEEKRLKRVNVWPNQGRSVSQKEEAESEILS